MKKSLFIFFLFIFSYLHASSEIARYYEKCRLRPNTRVTLKHREHGGRGYNLGYSTLNLFLSPNVKGSFMPFIDLRGHRFTDGRFAGNAGLGFRVSSDADKYIFGLNTYYDFRHANWISPHQLGAGLEVLGTNIDFRVNGYLPVGETKTTRSTTTFDSFAGHGITFKRPFRIAVPNVEGEIGLPIYWPFGSSEFYIAGGPYYLFKKRAAGTYCGNALGAKGRFTARFFDGFLLGVEASYDEVFYGTFQAYIAFNYPFGPANMRKKGSRWKDTYKTPCCDEYARLMARQSKPVERNEIIPICQRNGSYIPTFFDQNIIFVSNETLKEGNGTFEYPYPTLGIAETNSVAGDVIYVLAGEVDLPYEEGINLQEDQRLQGSGKPFVASGVQIPAYTPGVAPIIANPIGPGVVMADNTTVFGFTIEDCHFEGISADGASDILVQCNTIRANSWMGISALNLEGINTIKENTISLNKLSGIDLSMSNNAVVNIVSNEVSKNQFAGMELASATGLLNGLTVRFNTIKENDQYGMLYQDLGASIAILAIDNNKFSDHRVSEISMSNANASTFFVSNNAFHQSKFDTAHFFEGTLIDGFIDMKNNLFTGTLVQKASVIDLNDDVSNSVIIIADNFIDVQSIGLGNELIRMNIKNATAGSITIRDNELINKNVFGYGINIDMTSTGADWTSTIFQNTILAGWDGLQQNIAGKMRSTVSANNIDSLLNFGFFQSTNNAAADFCVEMDNNFAPYYNFTNTAGTYKLASPSGNVAQDNVSPLGPIDGFEIGAGVTQIVSPCPP